MDIDFWEFEDEMAVAGLFYNGLRGPGNPSHRESYMTCMDFQKMDKFLAEKRSSYTTDQWLELADYFDRNSYLSPINKLVANQIRNLLTTVAN